MKQKTNTFGKLFATLGIVAGGGLLASAAHAQSSVTLYGLLDEGITYTSNQGGSSAWQATNQNIAGTRWGLRGSEDLGGGLSAIFTLESGFSLINGEGAGSQLFNRQAFVGLSSKDWGTLTFGRQYDSVVDYLGAVALTGTDYGGVHAAHPFDNDNLDNSFRVNNAVNYTSANYNGLTFGGLYGFSNAAGGFSNNRAFSAGASYNYGGFRLAAAYLQLNQGGTGTGFNAAGAVTGDSTFNAARQQVFGAAASYDAGPGGVAFIFTESLLRDAEGINAYASGTSSGIVLNGGGAHFDNFELNGHYHVTPAITLSGGYTYTSADLDGLSPKWNQVNLLASYAFSKRTELYLQGDWQRASGTHGSGIGADLIGLPASTTNEQLAVTAGIQHSF